MHNLQVCGVIPKRQKKDVVIKKIRFTQVFTVHYVEKHKTYKTYLLY